MHHFRYERVKNEEILHCEGINLSELAKKVGTPFYCYSTATLNRHFRVFDESFEKINHLVCFSVKCNSNLAVLNLFAQKGSGFDIVSGGELERVLKAGGDAKKVVFSGVGKTKKEMIQALQAGILQFNVESEQELYTLNEVAKEMNTQAPVALRVNPDIDPKTHPYISTGLRKAKFGIDLEYAKGLFAKAKDFSNLDIIGVDCHIGSQLTELGPFLETMDSMVELITNLRKKGLNIQYLDIGGGLGITYQEEKPPHPRDYAEAIIPKLKDLDITLLMEPGRVIAGNAGILVSEVLFHKKADKKNFVIIDAAMNDLIRPALYQAHQEIQPVIKNQKGEVTADVVGPICETGDFLALDRKVPDFQQKDLLAVMSCGAYGFTMSSTYNTRPKVAEVLVQGDTYHVIRERENTKTLLRGERIPPAQAKKTQSYSLAFTKMHGNGNDFIVIDARNLHHDGLPWNVVSQKICDRHFGIGADQVLLLENPPANDPDSVITMGIYDADGSQVEMCGNGLRAMALYLWEEKISRNPKMKITLMDRDVIVERLSANRFQVDMGEPILEGKKIPVKKSGKVIDHTISVKDRDYTLTAVSMGNPHAVIYIDRNQGKVKDYDVATLGPPIEVDPFFPNRVNVEFVEVLNKREVNARIWERGTGETLACGSGVCAIAVAGVLTGKTERKITTHVPGGALELEWREENNHVYLTGDAHRVFDGHLDLADFNEKDLKDLSAFWQPS